jgi:hypothetical protein
MTPSPDLESPSAAREDGPDGAVAQIEQLCAQVRDGQMPAEAALRRIARLAHQDSGGPIYQKPLG